MAVMFSFLRLTHSATWNHVERMSLWEIIYIGLTCGHIYGELSF